MNAGESKYLSNYRRNKKSWIPYKDGLTPSQRWRQRHRKEANERCKKYFEAWRIKNPDKYAESNKLSTIRRRARRHALINAAKDKACVDCGVKYPYYVMHFDHLPGHEKKFNVSVARRKIGMSALISEIFKCDVVCANCHAQRTHDRRNRKSLTVGSY